MKPKDSLSIGELSKICRVSTRTLRHYDDIELLKPDKVDKNTGYRYYSRAQVFYVSVIHDLKDLGFSLTEIATAMKRDGIKNLKTLYKEKLIKINEQLNKLKQKQEKLNYRTQLFDKITFLEDNFQDCTEMAIQLQFFPERKVAFTRYLSRFSFEGLAFRVNEIQKIIEENNLNSTGTYYVIFHDQYENPNQSELEVGSFIDYDENIKDSKTIRIIPEGMYVTAYHWGLHEKSIPTYNKMLKWLEQAKYEVVGLPVKIYLKTLAITSSPDRLLSEIQIPVKKVH